MRRILGRQEYQQEDYTHASGGNDPSTKTALFDALLSWMLACSCMKV